MQTVIEKIITPEAQSFLNALHGAFHEKLEKLLVQRQVIQKELDLGHPLEFIKETESIREDPSWHVTNIPKDLEKRYVEITGPVDRKTIINALNSGANVFMADFEDALSPTWENVINGHANLMEAVRKTLCYKSEEGKEYSLKKDLATLVVRPRGLHMKEAHYLVDEEPISASLFDFGLFLFHNGKVLIEKGSGPYFYFPKLENRMEARFWEEVIAFSEKALYLPKNQIKVTVLIESILAAFQMEEILYELKDHIIALNAGRWDYIFSIIKKFSNRSDFLFPDRGQITMEAPFMKAYTELLVQTSHKRSAQAIGGMSAFIPSRKNPEINEIAFEQVLKDKQREVKQGFDGTWVAHKDLVEMAKSVFEGHTQVGPSKNVLAQDLLDFKIPGGKVTESGALQNVSLALQYINDWLLGVGAANINNLMEDAATAEISRALLWQWVHHGAFSEELIENLIDSEAKRLGVIAPAVILKKLVFNKKFIDFLTLEAYPYLYDKSR